MAPPGRVENSAAAWLAVALWLAFAPQAQGQSMSPLAAPPEGARLSAPLGEELRGGLSGGEPAYYGTSRQKSKYPRPYPPRRVHAGAPHPAKNPLPPLEPYKTSPAARNSAHIRAQPGDPTPEPPPTLAATPTIKAKPKPKPDPEPYDPVGIGVGSLRLVPFVEASGGYDSNPDRLSRSFNPSGSELARLDTGLKLRTDDWKRDGLEGDLRLGYVDYFDYAQANRPDGAGALVGHYDVTRDAKIDMGAHFTLDSQRPDAPAISSGLPNVTVTNRPIIFSSGGTLGASENFNRLEVSLRGSFDRTIYGNAHYSDGSTLVLTGTDFNDYGATGRVAYEVSPSLKPFIESTYDARVHDALYDPYGYERDSHGYAAHGGATVKFSELLSGEAGGGYAERDYQDSRLPKLRGPTVDASLVYTPSALTKATLKAATTLNETTVTGASGMLSRLYTAQLSHDLFRNLTLTALASYYTNDYQGAQIFEQGYTAGGKLEYKLSRSAVFKASYSHERLNSSAANASYTANVFLLGLRVQQ
jgi:hypothetical protein